MKLTKQVQTEILEVYHSYWDNYVKGDVEAMIPLLAAGYTQVGSAEGEVFSNKKDAVQFLNDTIDQVAGKLEMRNRTTKLEEQNNLILVHELCDLYALDGEEWIFYSKFRATTLMQQQNEEWKIIHQHSSFPDTKAEDGQNIAIDKIAAENQQLREAVKRRTIELEHKNRDLEIETALEKVRSRSLAMHKSNELQEVITTVLYQLNELGIAMDSAVVSLLPQGKQEFMCWIASKNFEYSESFRIPFGLKSVISRDFENYLSAETDHFIHQYSKEEKDDYYRELFEYSDFRHIPQARKDFLMSFGRFGHSTVLGKYTTIAALSYSGKILNLEEIEVLKRFLRVFEQAYVRFLDLQKAEEQAREAQIEAALERVRSASLAIHQSYELEKVVVVLFDKLKELGVPFDSAFIYFFDKSTRNIVAWVATHLLSAPVKVNMPFDESIANNPIIKDLWYAIENGENGLNKKYKEKDKDDYFLYEAKHNPSLIPETITETQLEAESWITSFATEKNSIVGFDSWEGQLTTEDDFQLLKRFAKVFEQAYIRFLDLQKAEAQAREAEIELALERVRARTMAMQHSNEMGETAKLLFQQVQALGIPAWSCGFNIWEKGDKVCTGWMSSNGILQPPFKIPLTESPSFIRQYESKQKGEDFYIEEVTGEALTSHYQYMGSLPDFGEILKDFLKSGFILPNFQINHIVNFKQGNMVFITGDKVPEAWDIFKRFAKVFEQTYTRFLDLQKAEAQAREAQIETALEKIRSRSLGMHQSDELKEVMGVMFKKLTELEILIGTVGILLFDEKTKNCDFWLQNQHQEPGLVKLPYDEKLMKDNYMGNYWDAKAKGQSFFNKKENIEQKNRHFEYVFAHNDTPQPVQEYLLQAQYHTQTFIIEKNSALLVDSWDERIYSAEQIEVLKRVAKVFEQAYIRFLDLQKAEAQAKEAQIEAALEKIRSTSLAMHKGEDLKNVVSILFQKLKELELTFDVAGIQLYTEYSKDIVQWVAAPDLLTVPILAKLPYVEKDFRESEILKDFWAAKENGKSYCNKHYSFNEKNKFFEYAGRHNDFDTIPADVRVFQLNAPGYTQTLIAEKRSSLWVDSYSGQTIPNEGFEILKRFARVFEQAYVRFLDLQKAEKQAREAQIEVALERVRSRSMAMHKSEELAGVMSVLCKEILNLGIHREDMETCYITTFEGSEPIGEIYLTTSNGDLIPHSFRARYDEDYYFKQIFEAWKNREPFLLLHSEGDELIKHYTFLYNRIPPNSPILELRSEDLRQLPSEIFNYILYFSQGYLDVVTRIQVPEYQDIFKRFGATLQQAYTRFLDLQKAEVQAREAQIEVALEKIRSRSLAMHHSDELKEVMVIMFEKMVELEVVRDGGIGIHLFTEGSNDSDLWVVNQINKPACIFLPYEKKIFSVDSYVTQMFKAKKKSVDIFNDVQSFEAKNRYFNYVFDHNGFETIPPFVRDFILAAPNHTFSMAIEKNSSVVVDSWTNQFMTEPEFVILKRVAKVFEQAYIRFLDLQKAEAQAREAQIQLAMERVRARTMAMQHSSELGETSALLFQQIETLGVPPWSCGFNIWEQGDTVFTSYMGSPDAAILDGIKIPLTEEATFIHFQECRDRGDKLFVDVLEGETLEAHYRYFLTLPGIKEAFEKRALAGEHLPTFQINHLANFSHGNLMFITYEPCPEAHDIFIRFTKVFEQSYTRFLDLQKAEASAQEAIKQSSLDRVRGEIASMRTADDLSRITPVVWHELTALGVPFFRCGVFIIKEKEQLVHVYLSTPEGKSLAVLHLPFDGAELTINAVDHWRKQQTYAAHWDREQFMAWVQTMQTQGQVQSATTYQGAESPPESLTLQFIPFNQGMLYIGSTDVLNEDQLSLAKDLANAFSVAYARFEDFKTIENTLSELKAAQSQLIQSEKMASLGELTAGIAHEIQNPLNFVNNFSEVSAEMIDEMNEVIEKGDFVEAKAISEDLKQNLIKINHHGNRASSIVKGMLEHSRTTSKEKELTDINALADEYLRLTYHGLRAKEKNFNSDFKTDFNPNLPKIEVFRQDIGRVLLNLINNAFWAVKTVEKPLVLVKTEQSDNQIIIKVIDNGSGMSPETKSKIFQPFFTTKPTGQGTGLGLSLAYDIVTKGHGGTIEVESAEGVGTEFIVKLPIV